MSPRPLLGRPLWPGACAPGWRLVLVVGIVLGIAWGDNAVAVDVVVSSEVVSSEVVGGPLAPSLLLESEEEVEEVTLEPRADVKPVATRWAAPPTAARILEAPDGPAPPPPRR